MQDLVGQPYSGFKVLSHLTLGQRDRNPFHLAQNKGCFLRKHISSKGDIIT